MNTKVLLSLVFMFFAFSIQLEGAQVDSIDTPELWLIEQNKIGEKILQEKQNFNKATAIFKTAHLFAKEQGLSDQFLETTINYGIASYKNGDIQNAYAVLSEILPKLENCELRLKAEVNQILGMTLVFQNKFPEGYKYQIDALTYYSEIDDAKGLMSIYYDLGSNFSSQGQSEMALENYEKGIELAKHLANDKMTILGNTAIGGTWASLKNFKKALEYSTQSLKLARQLNDEEELAWASINHGHILMQLDNNIDAEFFLQQANDLSYKFGNKLLTAYSLEQLSDCYSNQQQIEKAITYLDESYIIYQNLGQINNLQGLTKKYADIYFKQKNYKKYKEYTDKFIALKDSIYSKEMMESMASLKQDFEIQRMERENQIAMLTKDQEIANAKNYATSAIILGALATFILIMILMYNQNKAAKEKNEILTFKNAEILKRNEFLANSNRDLEKFAYVISHDLKEPLRNINGFTNLLNRKLNRIEPDEDIAEYARFITNGTEQMSALLTGLLAYSKVSINKGNKEDTDLKNTVQQVVDNFRIQLKERNCTINFDQLPVITCRSIQLTQVFQNLIANAIKFSQEARNNINIKCKDRDDYYEFSVQDQGIGIAPEYQEEIFVVFKRLHDRGTYTGSGIGLATCKKIIEEHEGKIWVESTLGKGSCFYFTLPKQRCTSSSQQNTKNEPTLIEA